MAKYNRHITCTVKIGNIAIGSDHPIAVQTMANTDTNDIHASVEQAIRCINNGTKLLRFTTQGSKEVENLSKIRSALHEQGYTTPLVADIHFNPAVALAAASKVDKIRINPGNFVHGKKEPYTDEEWQNEIDEIREKIRPIIETCQANSTAIRIGVNHGSLSSRIMTRYGNTPEGLAESCIEFIEICRSFDFHNVVLSIKSSNAIIMVHAVRLLVQKMDERGYCYPIHLGVTEAGSDEEGRIKSAVGIGTLLSEGIGDTIRVSLSEAPEKELPVAEEIVQYISSRSSAPSINSCDYAPPTTMKLRTTKSIQNVGGYNAPVVHAHDFTCADIESYCVELEAEQILDGCRVDSDKIIILTTQHRNVPTILRAAINKLERAGNDAPIIVKLHYDDAFETMQIKAACDYGPLLIDRLINGIYIEAPQCSAEEIERTSFIILQSARARITRTEYTSCPSCGRTKFNLTEAVQRVKAATKGYPGLKIAIMGCIVNGPGEMADADYGYIGAGLNRVSIYKKGECIAKNIPEEEALETLIHAIENN